MVHEPRKMDERDHKVHGQALTTNEGLVVGNG
jgi:hypothetical protein